MGMDHQQIVYKFRSTSKSKKIDEKTKYDLVKLEYSNFLKFWESTADIQKVTMEKKLKSDRSFNQNLPDSSDKQCLFSLKLNAF